MKNILVHFAYLGLLLVVSNSAHANLITNGSFEGNYDVGQFTTVFADEHNGVPNHVIDGWTVVGGSIDWIGSYWKASKGDKSIDLAGAYQHGFILGAEFDTVVGKTYRVQFDMAGNPDKPYAKSLMTVSTSSDPSIGTYTFTFDQTGNTHRNMGWETKFFDFVALNDKSQLYFGDVTGDQTYDQAWGAALDNVSVDLAPVPEPSTIFLLGAGLAGLGIFGRRFRK
ncbi:PEP-CTERM motif protein [Geobacter sp. OR-1]|uniref:choice-of-anchor C family PEP-CTERM protein n=1 Tax=Geobacter sp. OR-1 TaxID=1266765 RepID=UPI000542C835|nr:choice-of-anchor C family protein [Geobacter sp. OR-1]GAM11543.1 PEP-CTERM motif protein [Geobacter sp. OR-1]